MSDNLADSIEAVKKMVDSGNIPPDIQNMINNLQNNSSNSNQSNVDLKNMLNNISPEMISNLSSMLNLRF